ncbi:MAG TPA: glycosyltransferase family 2 protein [Bacteroidales bacterium]|nr:glycosyltransferase [Bacteroidales bacterium]HNZ42507.1 glycosyltransferase family 2 protein [Bacteroidales bacterium]HPB25167.1 glycosyltransferase family 2 protein [Bacteroidales bacterium]HPI31190.1 glycosyltransferase family 2 protein [Bacteroidales bacterium]HQN15718.1 glycosyltransferase family 2 protein [Bacteroidales bacterium]
MNEPLYIFLSGIDLQTALLYFVRIIEKLMVIYFTLYFLIDIFLFIYSLVLHHRNKVRKISSVNYYKHSVSIIVPAYNEEVSLVSCIKMLSKIDYDDFEIIVINDGSKDRTLQTMLNSFSFTETGFELQGGIKTGTIKKVYRDSSNKILLIDKENGGKADSVNAGLNISSKKYICTIDADSILDDQALKMVLQPMIENPHVFVTGGFLAASNGLVISEGKISTRKMPRNIWVLWQIVEYMKSFMIARLSLSKMNMLLIMSGAFSLYRKEDLLNIGGLLTGFNDHPYIVKTAGLRSKTVCEDMEVVIRLWRYYRENKIKGKVTFLPYPVCWTEVPDNHKNLFKQRARWHQGLGESLKLHRKIMFEPKYGATGLLAMPYYFIFEFLAPFMKIFSLVFLIVLSLVKDIDAQWILLLLISVLLITTIIMSVITVVLETKSKNHLSIDRKTLRYNTFGDWLLLLVTSIIGSVSYEFFKMFAQLKGIAYIMQKKSNWNKFERKGIKTFEN